MGKQIFNRIKRMTKTSSILLFVFFIISMTATSASATNVDSSKDYQVGYQAGAQDGYKVGYDKGLKDCSEYGQNDVLTKILDPILKDELTKSYKTGYKEGFEEGYIAGYNSGRFNCLKK
jgi:flagellar biosynthesis/type III secretory pathway protein FliH